MKIFIIICLISLYSFGNVVYAESSGSFELTTQQKISSYVKGCTYTADIFISPGTHMSNAADIIVRYDPSVLGILDALPELPGIQIQPGFAFQGYFGNVVDNDAGIIHLTGSSTSSLLKSKSLFGSILFKPLLASGTARFDVVFDGIDVTTDSNIVNVVDSHDVLEQANSLVFPLSDGICTSDTGAPSVEFVYPQHKGSGITAKDMFKVKLTDSGSGVNLSSTKIVLNGRLLEVPLSGFVETSDGYIVEFSPEAFLFEHDFSTLLVTISDFAGNEKSSSIYFNLDTKSGEPSVNTGSDTIRPTITINQPVSGQFFDNTLNFTVIDMESGIDLQSLRFVIDQEEFSSNDTEVTVGQVENGYKINLEYRKAFSQQKPLVSIAVADKAGNISLKSEYLNPGIELTSYTQVMKFWWILPVSLGVAALYFIRVKRHSARLGV